MMETKITSINNHLDKIEILEEERDNYRTSGPNVSKLKLSEGSKKNVMKIFQTSKKYKREGWAYCAEQREELEHLIDESAIILQEKYGIDVSTEEIHFQEIHPLS